MFSFVKVVAICLSQFSFRLLKVVEIRGISLPPVNYPSELVSSSPKEKVPLILILQEMREPLIIKKNKKINLLQPSGT